MNLRLRFALTAIIVFVHIVCGSVAMRAATWHDTTAGDSSCVAEHPFSAEYEDSLHRAANELEMMVAATKAEEEQIIKKVLIMTVIIALATIVALIFIIRKRNSYTRLLRQKNNELEVLRDKAEEAERMKASILKNMSHEVRTPLNIISGFTQIMSQTDFNLSVEERVDIAGRIEKSSNDIVRIINDLLYISSKESNSYILRDDMVVCNKICRDIIAKYRDKAAAGVKIAFGSDVDDRFAIKTNRDGASRIIECLLENACKFTVKGHIGVACRMSGDGKSVEISVTDTGCGIAEKDKEKVFDLFYKTDDNRDGLGIGLSIAQRVARQIGGNIALDTGYTDGARFIVTLPVAV